MYHQAPDMDSDFIRAWTLIHELSDQLAHNQKMISTLASQAGRLQAEAGHFAASGFNLRRFNTEISKERFESERERTNAATVIENHALVQENRQLSLLLKEYEHAMENIMNKFRSYTVAAQQHESNIVRHYETLLTQESQPTRPDFINPAATAMPLFHLSHNLRALVYAIAGRPEPDTPGQEDASEEEAKADGNPTENPQDIESDEALLALIENHDWMVDRETEIQRLETENEQLRKMLGIDEASAREYGLLADEERERDRYLSSGSSSSLSTRSTSTSTSFSSSSLRPLSLSTSLSTSTSSSSLLSTPATTPGVSVIPRSPRPPPSGLMLNNLPMLNLVPPPALNILRNPDNQLGGPQQQQQQQQQQQGGSLGRGGGGAGPPRVAGVFGSRLVGRGGAPPAPWFSGGGGSIIDTAMGWD
ncbi:hypothetical protein BDM02DRAFT_3157776 [Thelephora ganbajun]|uniref:Uncharacterized protein n=1 Tax=Thelephora ganbajun TaxID=370292 RepID=A0ACB6ZXQ4_THEGA|nr:hypothetical protein BDM02DRAFT_3157776 [Thelephora ganbajun]